MFVNLGAVPVTIRACPRKTTFDMSVKRRNTHQMKLSSQNAPKRKPVKRKPGVLSASGRRLLGEMLNMQLEGAPIELLTWRARNAKKIVLLEELRQHHMWDGDTHAHVNFWGLLNARGPRAERALKHVERLFRVLSKHYRDHPTGSLDLAELAKLVRLPESETLQAAQFLARSPASLSIGAHEPTPLIAANENYVTLGGFDGLKARAREFFERPIAPQFLPGIAPQIDGELLGTLTHAESEAVRDAWRKVQERLPQDPEGAITSARALIEAGCKFVLEEAGEVTDTSLELPKLYKLAAEHLRLDIRTDIDDSLRRVLAACATIVDGIAHLRNRLSDAHGKDRRSAKPGRRHAEFIVLISAAMTALLVSSQDAQRTL